MQLLLHQQAVGALRNLATEGVSLLVTSQFELLVEQYGYAMSHGRNPVDAVKLDLARALADASGRELRHVRAHDISVVIYHENAIGLRAAIDCEVPTETGKNIWVSFVVAATEAEQFLTLEDICTEFGPD